MAEVQFGEELLQLIKDTVLLFGVEFLAVAPRVNAIAEFRGEE